MWRFFVCFCAFVLVTRSDFVYENKKVNTYQVAGIFDGYSVQEPNAFVESMERSSSEAVKVEPIVLKPPRPDSYTVWRELCGNSDMRPVAVIGPQNEISDGAVRDQCAIAHIPHIQATWQPLDTDLVEDEQEEEKKEEKKQNEEKNEEEQTEEELEETNDEETNDEETNGENEPQNDEEPKKDAQSKEKKLKFKDISINFYPYSDEINIAFAKLLRYYNWENFAVLYEDEFGLMRIQKILANYTDKFPVTVRKLHPNGDNAKIFKEIYKYQDSRILLDCEANNIPRYLDEAESQKMADHYLHYIYTSLDVSIVTEDVVSRACNSSWLSLTKDERPDLGPRVGKWDGDGPSQSNHVATMRDFSVDVLLMDDIAKHLMAALNGLDLQSENTAPQYPICGNDADTWEHGAKLQNLILNTQTDGLTGHIEFDKRGRRQNYKLFVFEKAVNEELQVVGEWESANGTQIKDTRTETESSVKHSATKVFRVMSAVNAPYFSCIRKDCQVDPATGKKYEGFVVDLIDEIFKYFKKEKQNYSYKFVDKIDLSQGKYDRKIKKWNGMIGELLDKKIDLAACDFTITEARKKVIDFSVPFMSLGISILYVKEQKKEPAWFSFLNPYTVDVWLYAMTAYFAVSIVLYICARISPADWENPEPCDKDPEELENIWSFKNCAWLTMGSIMTQGCDILPKAIGTRWVCGMWWFFAVIFCQTYIAQLSASMTSALTTERIDGVEDLAKQTKILYGAFKEGSTLEFFRSSKDKMYRKMYDTMAANEAVLVKTNDEGVRRVLSGEGKYAFFMESSTIEYKTKRNCNLKKVNGELDSKDYGIAMPANSPFRTQINRAILSMKEATILETIRKKWWEQGNGTQNCEEAKPGDETEGDLEVAHLIGLFIVLIVGLFLSLIVTAAEFFNEVRNIVIREKLTHKEAFVQEWKASLNLLQMEKPILKNPSRAPSVQSLDSSEKKQRRTAAIENFMDFEKEVQ